MHLDYAVPTWWRGPDGASERAAETERRRAGHVSVVRGSRTRTRSLV